MKLIQKTITRGSAGTPEETFSIPTTTVIGGTTLIALLQLLATILGNAITARSGQQEREELSKLREKNLTVQLLQRVLESEDAVTRANSLQMLIAMDLLPDGKLAEIAKDPHRVPRWEKHPLEIISPGNALMPTSPNINTPGTDSLRNANNLPPTRGKTK